MKCRLVALWFSKLCNKSLNLGIPIENKTMERSTILKTVVVLFGVMTLAAGCAGSKCDCPKFHGEAPVQQEQNV